MMVVVPFLWITESKCDCNFLLDHHERNGLPSFLRSSKSSIFSHKVVPKVSGKSNVSIPPVKEQTPITIIAKSFLSSNATLQINKYSWHFKSHYDTRILNFYYKNLRKLMWQMYTCGATNPPTRAIIPHNPKPVPRSCVG